MPKSYGYLEERIKKLIKGSIRRGRVEVYVKSENTNELDCKVVPNVLLAKQYAEAIGVISDEISMRDDITLSFLSRFPDVLSVEKIEEDETAVWDCMSEAIGNAIEKAAGMRIVEGEQIKTDIVNRLDVVIKLLIELKNKAPEVVLEYKERLSVRIKELLNSNVLIDEGRIETEVAFFADKSSIDEELVRFDSHIHELTSTLEENDSIGRKLDFLLQEMNREINTIGSKANHLAITNSVVKIKSELEKIREQVQNIE